MPPISPAEARTSGSAFRAELQSPLGIETRRGYALPFRRYAAPYGIAGLPADWIQTALWL